MENLDRRQLMILGAVAGATLGAGGYSIARRLARMKSETIFRVHFSKFVDAGPEGIATRQDAIDAALVWMWGSLVERHIDPVTRRADLGAMRTEFEKAFRSWVSKVETLPQIRA